MAWLAGAEGFAGWPGRGRKEEAKAKVPARGFDWAPDGIPDSNFPDEPVFLLESAFGGDEAGPAPFRCCLNSFSANRDAARRTPHEKYCAPPPVYGFMPGVETGGVAIFLPEVDRLWHIGASK